MANEIHWRNTNTNYLLYFTIRDDQHAYYNTLTLGFETLSVDNWSEYANYLDETPANSYLYLGDFISGLNEDWYWIDIFEQEEITGASPGPAAISDTLIGTIVGFWNLTTFQPWDANISAINNNITSATQLALSAAQILNGTVDTGTFTATTTKFEASSFLEEDNCFYNGRVIIFDGTLVGQAALIEDYEYIAPGRSKFTVSELTRAPINGDTFIVV